MTAQETDAERAERHARMQAGAAKLPEPTTRIVLPVVCNGTDGHGWPSHCHRRIDGIWTCRNCDEPRPAGAS